MSLLASIMEFDREYAEIHDNPECRKQTKENLELQKSRLETIKNTTMDQLTQWKKGKISAKIDVEIDKNPSILKKAKMIRTTLKILKIFTKISGVAFAGLLMASCGWHFINFLNHAFSITAGAFNSVFTGILTGHQVAYVAPHLVIPFGLKMLTGAAVGSGVLSFSSKIGIKILNSSRILREEQAIKNKNFKEFITEYVRTEQFIPSRAHLSDRKLHDIFAQWEKANDIILRR